MSDQFALHYNNEKTPEVFETILQSMPKESEAFIYGGAMRNVVFNKFHGMWMVQRDYDQIVTGGSAEYLNYLEEYGFHKGGIVTPQQVIMAYDFIPDASPQGYDDSLVFDIHPVDREDILEYMTNNVGLTISGIALPIRSVFDTDWYEKVIALPNALEDIRNKQLRVNLAGYQSQAANIFACLRFISAGFAPPTKLEMQLLLNELPKLEKNRFKRNLPKLYGYVGGESKARKLCLSLGIKDDLFDYNTVQNGSISIV